MWKTWWKTNENVENLVPGLYKTAGQTGDQGFYIYVENYVENLKRVGNTKYKRIKTPVLSAKTHRIAYKPLFWV